MFKPRQRIYVIIRMGPKGTVHSHAAHKAKPRFFCRLAYQLAFGKKKTPSVSILFDSDQRFILSKRVENPRSYIEPTIVHFPNSSRAHNYES